MDTPTSTRPALNRSSNGTNKISCPPVNQVNVPTNSNQSHARAVQVPLINRNNASPATLTPSRTEGFMETPPCIPSPYAITSLSQSGAVPLSQMTPKRDSALQFTYDMKNNRQEGSANRYCISAKLSPHSATLISKTPVSYRHLIDLTSSNIQCTDVLTGEEFLCKIVNEPVHKVQKAYFALENDTEGIKSTIYGHTLIRKVHDIVPLSNNRTYIIISPITEHPPKPWESKAAHNIFNNSIDNYGVKEDLHTYIRSKKRLCETEARHLFHQICQTVQVCHRNGIILRDLKLKRFFFIDEARTKLQYESLEGSMILSDANSDVLSDKIGCPLYTAPELLCPFPTYHGKPADMWSLGVILYTMLVGQYPFYEKGNCNLITVIRHCHVQIPVSLSRSVRWLLLGLLRKNYEERLTANQIFMSPWLKEQRPFYTYIPVDVEISDSDTEMCEDTDEDMGVHLIDEDDNDLGVQPLDYTCATLSSVFGNNDSAPITTNTNSDESLRNHESVSNYQSHAYRPSPNPTIEQGGTVGLIGFPATSSQTNNS